MIFLRHLWWKVFNFLAIAPVCLHVSITYNAVGRTMVLYSWGLIFKSIVLLVQLFRICWDTAAAVPTHILTLSHVPPSFARTLPRYRELPISSTVLLPTEFHSIIPILSLRSSHALSVIPLFWLSLLDCPWVVVALLCGLPLVQYHQQSTNLWKVLVCVLYILGISISCCTVWLWCLHM